MRVWLFCLCILLSFASQVAGRGEYRLGGVDGNPWQDALSTEAAGVYSIFDENGQEARRVSVAGSPHGAGADTLIDFSGTSIQPRSIDPAVNLTLTDPASSEIKIPLPYIGGKIRSMDGCSAEGQHIPIIKKMFDGDLTTAHFRRFTQSPNAQPGIGEGWRGTTVVDFGAAVPINRVRFYPRLSRADDALLIQGFRSPQPPSEAFGEDSFSENFLAWYEIRAADNSVPFSDGCDFYLDTADLEVLRSTQENLEVVVDLRFPTRSIRFLTLQPFPLRNWEVAEFEVYGEGFVEQTLFTTQILDFGKPINWGKVRWSAELPEGTRVEVRTRTGKTPDPHLYFAETINGGIRQISLEEYTKIDPTGRLPTRYDAENWSFWSPPYDFKAGLRDESHPPEAWKDGTPLLSPGPSRYIQIAVRLFATFTAAPRLDQLVLQFSEAPSAQEIVAEIWPIEVNSFAPTTFTYVVRPTFQREDAGFDRLEILTHARVDTLRSIAVDGEEIDRGLFPPQILDDRIVVALPMLAGEEDSFKQIEVVFDAPVLRFGTEFSSWAFASADPAQIKQRISPGNATFRFSGDVLAVSTPVGGELLVDVKAFPRSFTPNGDGVNDLLTVSYKLREVVVERPVSLSIYDLGGNVVREEAPTPSRSGEFHYQWNGRDASGRLVPPGTYLYKLSLRAEETKEEIGSFSVVY